MCLSKVVNCRRREAPVLVTGGPFKKRSATCEKREAYLRRGALLVKKEAYLRRGALLVKKEAYLRRRVPLVKRDRCI
jgi:hypothetical protein